MSFVLKEAIAEFSWHIEVDKLLTPQPIKVSVNIDMDQGVEIMVIWTCLYLK